MKQADAFFKQRIERPMEQTRNAKGPSGQPFNIDPDQTFGLTYLVNKLNFINFIGGSVLAVFFHNELEHDRCLSLLPQPCNGPELTCCWEGDAWTDQDSFRFGYLLVEVDGSTLLANAELLASDGDTLLFQLPATCHPIRQMPSRRKINPGLTAEIFQKGIRYVGRIVDYSADHMDIFVTFAPPQTRHWIDPDAPVYLVLLENNETCYSGTCVIDTGPVSKNSQVYRLMAEDRPFHRYQPKKYRNKRVNLCPAPTVMFTHPLSLAPVSCMVEDISGMGFSFTADGRDTAIFTGLIISGVRLEIAGELLVLCKAQVVHRCRVSNAGAHPVVRFGMAILDIDIADHTRLQRMIQQAADPNAHVNGRVPQQALWAFFFDTGFMYPKKYGALEDRKKAIQKTYNKLYLDQPAFARHFTYQKRGTILGHMAMIRVYTKAWLIHHHAARSADDATAGLRVLEQMGQFVNESHALEAIQMEYIFFFYRPDNKFPSLLFGKAAQFVNDPEICSLDKFAYGHFHRSGIAGDDLPRGWSLSPAQDEDLSIFNAFYRQASGGLMAKAFDLAEENNRFDDLAGEYHDIGFKRERRMVSLKHEGRLNVFFEINLSEIGLNMSDLTNCIRLFVVDSRKLDKSILATAVNRLAEAFSATEVPILIFPADETAISPVPVDRQYLLWIYNLRYTDRYFAFMNRIIRFSFAGGRHRAGKKATGSKP